jgi:hypothetical protein
VRDLHLHLPSLLIFPGASAQADAVFAHGVFDCAVPFADALALGFLPFPLPFPQSQISNLKFPSRSRCLCSTRRDALKSAARSAHVPQQQDYLDARFTLGVKLPPIAAIPAMIGCLAMLA